MKNSIVVYDSGEIELKVSIDNETLWASINDIANIFDIDRSVVSRHIKNIFNDKELDEKLVCAKFAHTTKHGALDSKTQTKMINYYNLDIILAVGYRTNSTKAIKFRQWATKVLKEYIFNGYAINSEKITQKRLLKIEDDIKSIQSHISNNSLELKQGIFYNGQIYDAYKFLDDMLKTATKEIIVVDNYIDNTLLTLISKYSKIEFIIITKALSKQQKLDIAKYQSQYNNLTIKISNNFHDRFVVIDEDIAYHIGASLKDLGKRVFGFNKIDIKIILEIIKKGIIS